MSMKKVRGLSEVPEGMDGIVVGQVVCVFGCPHVVFMVWVEGEMVAERLMEPGELESLSETFTEEAAECARRRKAWEN